MKTRLSSIFRTIAEILLLPVAAIVKYKNYIQLVKSIDRITLLDIVLAEDCILDIVP